MTIICSIHRCNTWNDSFWNLSCLYHNIMSCTVEKFARYAINVWNMDAKGKSNTEIAKEGLEKNEKVDERDEACIVLKGT